MEAFRVIEFVWPCEKGLRAVFLLSTPSYPDLTRIPSF